MVIRSLMVFMAIISMSAGLSAQTQSMQIAGVTRTYIVHTPTGLSNPPLVFNIHGYNMDAASEQSYTQMDKVADREKFIVVYPNAIDKSWDLSGANDFALILAIIDTVDKKYHIDKGRIYSCGFSQGGFMSFQLACRYSDIFAAIAPTSGTLNGACTLKRPMSMRLTFGTNDVATPSAFMQSVTTWLKLDSCPATPVVTRPYPSTNSNSVVTRLYYGPCAQGTEVVADSIHTGQHEWPMNTNDRINNSEETWSFLKKFSLKGSTAVRGRQFFMTHSNISASYCSGSGIVRLQGVGEKCPVRVIDTKGRLVASTVVMQHQFVFKNRLSSGVYMAIIDGISGSGTLRLVIP